MYTAADTITHRQNLKVNIHRLFSPNLYILIIRLLDKKFLDMNQVSKKLCGQSLSLPLRPAMVMRVRVKGMDWMKCPTCHAHTCVQKVPVFDCLSEQELQVLGSIIESSDYSKGSLVFHEGEQAEALYIVKNGLIKLTHNNNEGKQHNLRFLFPGDYFGQFALLHNTVNDVTAEVIENSTVCRILRKDFIPLLKHNAELTFSFLMSVSEQLHQAEEQAGALHMFEVEKRLSRMLLYFHTRNQSAKTSVSTIHEIKLPAAKKELASMIGITAETLSRKLTKLEASCVIKVSKRTINILDLPALYQLAEICE